MCGILAILNQNPSSAPRSLVDEMTDIVSHRGPDARGVQFFSQEGGRVSSTDNLGHDQPWQCALGHRRLSILDLTSAGSQPMKRDNLWVTFNGEIYNYLELRKELEQSNHQFISNSDTEVILAAYQQWGTECFAKFRGMWGIVIYDLVRQKVIISRDHIGIKPVYTYRDQETIIVVSELKQLIPHPNVQLKPQDESVVRYLLMGYEDSNSTFFENIQPFQAGTYEVIDLNTLETIDCSSFWFPEKIQQTISCRNEAAELFQQVISDSVYLHIRSDVPVGCTVSGGLDSSVIASCSADELRKQDQQLNSFSVIFPGHPINEQEFVKQIVNYSKLTPHYITPSSETFIEDFERFTFIHDEPVGSLAQYAAYALARLCRENDVPVILNGQGGDEVLSGYWQSYFTYLKKHLKISGLPRLIEHFCGSLLPGGNYQLVSQIPTMIRRYRSRSNATELFQLKNRSDENFNSSKTMLRVLDMNEQERRVTELRELFLPRLLKWDDRNSMAFSIEGRYPILEPKVMDACLSIKTNSMFYRGWTKEPLRRGFKDRIPNSITRRKSKFGFETPQEHWLLHDLKPVITELLVSDSPVWDYVEPSEIQKIQKQFEQPNQSNSEELGQVLFRVLNTDRWMKAFQLNRKS